MLIRTLFLMSLRITFYLGLFLLLLAAVGAAAVKWYFLPQLPAIETLRDTTMQVPLRVFTKDNKLMSEFGEQRRIPLEYKEIPELMIKAVLAAEDDRFFNHIGIDFKAMARASVNLVLTGEKSQGGSTITMQVARNFFLTPERTFTRKINEMLLAITIDNDLSKEEILRLYLNKIFFGHRAYGIGAAAQVYFGKEINKLSLAQFATLAGLPKAPSTNNPVTNPDRALERRNYILARMLELNYINQEQYKQAVAEPLGASLHNTTIDFEAGYISEMVRSYMEQNYGETAYTNGYRVYTTINSRTQDAAQKSVWKALHAYGERHGYIKPNSKHHIDLPKETELKTLEALDKATRETLKNYPNYGDLISVVAVNILDKERQVRAYSPTTGEITINWENMAWARPYVNEDQMGASPRKPSDLMKRGDIISVRPYYKGQIVIDDAVNEDERLNESIEKANKEAKNSKKEEETEDKNTLEWRLAQKPMLEGSLVSLQPESGAIIALVGGFDFNYSKFNRALQALRQPGSNFKPFIYSAAMDLGFTPASTINDAPIVYQVGTKQWKPENFSGKYYGMTSLREALTHSRNLVSIRLLDEIGIKPTTSHLLKFGFVKERIPQNLTTALGTGEITPMELARGYSVFANSGYLIEPHLIERIEDVNGNVVYQTNYAKICYDCQETLLNAPPTDSGNQPVLEQTTLKNQASANLEAMQLAKFTASAEHNFITEKVERRAPLVLRPQNAWIMTSIMQDVVRYGTARRALSLKRNDLAGKTGTTNGPNDAWFSGYTPDVVTTTWVGFDQPRSLGKEETGGRAALPMWIDFMSVALKDKAVREPPKPSGLITVRIDPKTGLLAKEGQTDAVEETFYSDAVPKRYTYDISRTVRTTNIGAPAATSQPQGDVVTPKDTQMLW